MEKALYDKIPSLDLSDFTEGTAQQKSAFVRSLGDAYEQIGFVALKNHGLTDERIDSLYRSVQEFFALNDVTKQKYEIKGLQGQRGYTGKLKEHAKDQSVPDLKEFYHIGQPRDTEDQVLRNYPDNVWPDEVTSFEEETLHAYHTLEQTGLTLLRAIAIHLGLEERFFDDKVSKGNSILRPIHYFPIENPDSVPDGAVRAAQHGDINLITLLMGASAEGLQVLRRDGKWIPITALPDQVIVNVGDMLDRLTNHKLKSTIHRVVNPPRDQLTKPRYSIPFFMHPRSDMDLTSLENCIDEQHPKRYDDISAGDFLQQRLTEIGLIK